MKRLGLALVIAASSLSLPAFADAPKSATALPSDQVSLAELQKASETKSATIIDANGTKMYEEGHVPGAISFAKVEGKLATVLPKDKAAPIFAYCGGPMCTAWEEAAKEAKAAGYTNIKHYKGGIKGWKEAGMKVETGAPKA